MQEDYNSSAHDSNMYVVLSGLASSTATAATLYVLRAPSPLYGSKAADINQSVQNSRSRSSSDAPLPSSYSAMSLVAVLPAAADKEITRLTICAGSQQQQALIIASSTDGCVRAFRMSAGAANAELPYALVSVWLIPAVKNELKEWYTQPLPHMTATNVLDDDANGDEAEQQPWLQAPQGLLPSQAAKSPSAAGNRLRSAVKSIAAVSALSQMRDFWLLGGSSSSTSTARWYSVRLQPTDVRRIVDADTKALSHAVAACDVLPVMDVNFCRSNPQNAEVLACTVAVAYRFTVLAGYVDGTVRIWKRISLNAPPPEVRKTIASELHGNDKKFCQYGVLGSFYCYRTFKLSEHSIADVVMTFERRCAVICDAMGMQFVISVCCNDMQKQHAEAGFNWFNDLQMPFSFTTEPTEQVCSGVCSL